MQSLDSLHALTHSSQFELLVEIAIDGHTQILGYSEFAVGGPDGNY